MRSLWQWCCVTLVTVVQASVQLLQDQCSHGVFDLVNECLALCICTLCFHTPFLYSSQWAVLPTSQCSSDLPVGFRPFSQDTENGHRHVKQPCSASTLALVRNVSGHVTERSFWGQHTGSPIRLGAFSPEVSCKE